MLGSGTPSAEFAAFYRATLAPLRRYLSRMIRCRAEAEDLAHDAYVRIYSAMGEQRVAEPQAFLYTTARRLALNQLKRSRHEPVAGSDSPAFESALSPAPGVERAVMARQEWAQLERALSGLPAGCRSVLLLRKVEHRSHEEIAERLGISRSTVEKQLARALRLLRESLNEADAPRRKHENAAEKLPAVA
jgi:RNA polymerase sigma factor (sigma-70 family)